MLIGVGLGPGDPQLLTLKAISVLQSATKVFVPGKKSYELVRPYADAEILKFPMTTDNLKLRDAWELNVHIIAQYAAKESVAFGVLGDPNVFSTFSHLNKMMKELRPDIIVETVPGVSAITSCVSRIDFPLESSFIVSDGSSVQSKIILKVKRPQELADKLVADGYNECILIERAFTNKERIYRYHGDLPPHCDYFSIMYGKRT